MESDMFSVIFAERGRGFQRKHLRQQGIVSDFRMRIQREMCAVQRNGIRRQHGDPAGVQRDNAFQGGTPADAMMHKNEIGIQIGGNAEQRQRSIHAENCLAYIFGSFELQSVVGCIGPEISDPQQLIQISGDFFQFSHLCPPFCS